jgi:hypothetical protein
MRLLDLAPRACALSLALLLPACVDKGEDSDGGTTDGTDTDPQATETQPTETQGETDAPAGGCECAAPSPCSVSLCDTVKWSDADDDGEVDADAAAALEAALTCALEALRDDKAGRIRWETYINIGQYSEYGTFELFGDGTARTTEGGSADLCSYLSEAVGVGPVKDAQFFSDCLADPDLKNRFECVRGAGADGAMVCDEGELNCDGV